MSLVAPDEAARILGFPIECLALAFPYPGAVGSNGKPAYIRLKPDTPFQPAGWKKPEKYLAPLKSRTCLYIAPTLDRSVLSDPTAALIVTEGEKKALAAIQAGFPCLSFAGVWNFSAGKDTQTGQRHIIPDVDLVRWEKRTVYLCYDSDAKTNPHVLAAERAIATELQARGARVLIVRLPVLEGLKKTGLDDLLTRKNSEALSELLETSEEANCE